ncbi:MAG: FAD-dependent oxidoreductase [Lachnospiraceae bacterium]
MQKKRLLGAVAFAVVLALAGCSQKTTATEATTVAETTTAAATEDQKAGVYTQTAKGNNGDIKVEVEIKDGAVVSIQVVEHQETAGIADKPIADIPVWIVENQSLAVDAVSGATNTSNAIVEAVALCLEDAGLDAEEWKARTVETKAEAKEDAVCDTVVVGAGGAGMKVALELADNGQNVILVEKQEMTGGATSLAATYFVAVDTSFHKEAGIVLSIDDYIANTMRQIQ